MILFLPRIPIDWLIIILVIALSSPSASPSNPTVLLPLCSGWIQLAVTRSGNAELSDLTSSTFLMISRAMTISTKAWTATQLGNINKFDITDFLPGVISIGCGSHWVWYQQQQQQKRNKKHEVQSPTLFIVILYIYINKENEKSRNKEKDLTFGRKLKIEGPNAVILFKRCTPLSF